MPGSNDLHQTPRLESIQFLRAMAVFFVVISHSARELSMMLQGRVEQFDEKLFPGDFGVDLFFVVSGFVMVYTCWNQFEGAGSARNFFLRRLIRIVPLYWVATTLMISVVVLMPASVNTATNDTGQWIASYLFWPYQREGDGLIRPVLGLGWSLQYEMLFYLLFSLALFFPRRFALPGLILTLALLVPLSSSYFANGGFSALGTFLAHPVILEFAFGVAIAMLYMAGARIPVQAGIVLFTVALIGLVQVPSFDNEVDQWRFLLYGVPASMMVASAVLTKGFDSKRVYKPLLEAGEISYSVYLVHPFVVGAMAMLFRKTGLDSGLDPVSLIVNYSVLVVILSFGISYAVHYLFDKPVTSALRTVATGRSRKSSAAGTANLNAG